MGGAARKKQVFDLTDRPTEALKCGDRKPEASTSEVLKIEILNKNTLRIPGF
ncbi:hypothetical protein ACSAZL_13860 [Methanosarcina sp. T3]|uniref:hypothetical protein n=1 Tax=Methanosarcina sp. T3 TaxID=3439062 RepID=UPI003F86B3D3